MKNKKFKLKRIPVVEILQVLDNLYQQGYDYFDLEGEQDPEGVQDSMVIVVTDEYFIDEDNNNSEENKEKDTKEFNGDYEELI